MIFANGTREKNSRVLIPASSTASKWARSSGPDHTFFSWKEFIFAVLQMRYVFVVADGWI